jgi:hypothetical protein
VTKMQLALAAIRLSPEDFHFKRLTGSEPLFPSLCSPTTRSCSSVRSHPMLLPRASRLISRLRHA